MIRLSKINIENFKNVLHGQIDLNAAENGPNILAVYGQNGSGKTSLIEAVQMLKYLLTGRVIPSAFADAIHVDSPYARAVYGFSVLEEAEEGELYETGQVSYDVSIKRQEDGENNEAESAALDVFSEILSFRPVAQGKPGRWITLADTSTEIRPFAPAKRASQLFVK